MGEAPRDARHRAGDCGSAAPAANYGTSVTRTPLPGGLTRARGLLPEADRHTGEVLNPERVLIVCTGNVCRSPYIERRLAFLTGSAMQFVSAGVQAVVGSAMSPGSARQLQERGGEPMGFEARQLTSDMIDDADLVLCATRDHRRQVVQLDPRGLSKTFALADFSDLVGQVPDGPLEAGPMDRPDEGRLTRLARAAARERGTVNARPDTEAAIVDPIGQPDAVYAQMADQVEALLPAVLAGLNR